MPRASLTPLGRQLRSVLAHIRPVVGHVAAYHASRSAQSNSPASALRRDEERRAHSPRASPSTARYTPMQQRRGDVVGDALRRTGQSDAAPQIPRQMENKPDLSYMNVSRRSSRGVARGRSEDKHVQRRARPAGAPRLQQLLAKYIRHRAAAVESEHAEPTSAIRFTLAEMALLDARGYTRDDVDAWADMVSSVDALEAAVRLQSRVASPGPHSVPLFVLLYLLRKAPLTAHTLRIIIPQIWTILEHRKAANPHRHMPVNAVFIIFVRLLRHARQVWPMALESLPDFLFKYLPNRKARGEHRLQHELETLTYMMNKALRLLSIRVAIEPFKNNHFQEAAIVHILRFMVEHNPPLLINREGYRAVAHLQLAQPKAPKEQQWAELKSLSWPPWKVERTAMDSDITFADHGLSKASETLMRMREAGYGPHVWEKAASIYAGWDTDRTPTIQTRIQLGTGRRRFRSLNALWAARISTTRTVQEAWAAFLAYEDQKLRRPRQDVYLAIFKKLHKEEERKRESPVERASSQSTYPSSRLFPGDTQEVEPLPPSTHLYTYTRTPPPTMHDLYLQLHRRGAVFNGHCLAFLITNAGLLQEGLAYLRDSLVAQGDSSDPTYDLTHLPVEVFAALVQLLCRFSDVPFPSALFPEFRDIEQHIYVSWIVSRKVAVNNHSIVRAMELLAIRRLPYRPAWNSVFQALARGRTFSGFRSTAIPHSKPIESPEDLTATLHSWQASILTSRFMSGMLKAMRGTRLDMDYAGFLACCQIIENAAVASWRLLEHHHETRQLTEWAIQTPLALVQTKAASRLNAIFDGILGDQVTGHQNVEQRADAVDEQQQLPKLLMIPNPPVLHSYIRTLGWIADFESLSKLVLWMAHHRTDLAERCSRDRNGNLIMRRAIVSLRVFLERSWLPTTEMPKLNGDAALDSTYWQLRRLTTPASVDIVEKVRTMVESVEDWGGWPDDEEVAEYCAHSRFQQFK